MPEHELPPDDWKPEDDVMFGLPSKGSTPPIELPPHLEQAMADALNKPAAEAPPDSPQILPGKEAHRVPDAHSAPEAPAEALRALNLPGEVKEIYKRVSPKPEFGISPTRHPETDEQKPLVAEVNGIMQQELMLLNRITQHEQDSPGWMTERDSIEKYIPAWYARTTTTEQTKYLPPT